MSESYETTCCIVGAGPAGAVLALILARQGIATTLLEAHQDFDREFRGDTVHPSVMEIMDEMGLAERLLELPHAKVNQITVQTATGPVQIADLRRIRTRFPYIAMLPQSQFLEFITAEAAKYPTFRLLMGTRAEDLLEHQGAVCGVGYQTPKSHGEIRARLTVGADGRFSKVRRLSGFEPIKTSPPMDVLWFRLPRNPGDPQGVMGRFVGGRILILLDRGDYWQIGYVIPKGSYQQLRAKGIGSLRNGIVEIGPELSDRVDLINDWQDCTLLSVESDRLPRWYREGLLLIGDAAHVMSPVAGVGINYAIQDAVIAANILTTPLRSDRLTLSDLATVQREREWPTRIIQAFQTLIQRRVISSALSSTEGLTFPWLIRLLLRIPLTRDLPGRFIGLGVRRVHLSEELKQAYPFQPGA